MRNKKDLKPWRVNIWIIFWDKSYTHLNRERTQNILLHLAWLYKLDHAVSSDKIVEGLPTEKLTQDLIYF
jgi:hypothetical protein